MSDARLESEELREYRLKARAWLATNVRPLGGAQHDDDNDVPPERIAYLKATQAKLDDAGYAGFMIPVEYGGQGLTPEHELVFFDEARDYDIPFRFFGVTIGVTATALVECANHEQKMRYIPKMLSGEERWVQLLSEPSGGSDVAGVLTSATRDGDHYIVNGQKVWSTGAHLSDFCLCPVRTRWDVPKHKGISVLIVDLRSPGIEIRRIKQIDGQAEFCEEFFTDVAVPVSNLVGDENDGWRVTRTLLDIEHASIGRPWSRRPEHQSTIADIVALAIDKGLADDVGVRRQVVDLHVASEAQNLLRTRVARGFELGKLPAGYGGVTKLANDSVVQRRDALAFTLAGADGVTWPSTGSDRWSRMFLSSRSRSIGGGTDEIQRNNVSEKVLGMPREPAIDLDVPFNEVPHN